ncbi:unnamed protein product [Hymenolepis diminuta]|uniref:Syntaxin N-terminal domain-containing protein n=1 Tax=Hymenolepis diminuta TaxID=6216 RepID=A0A564ZFI9_HYMDI|nr:unnamed protein product [Hymenolepis diminuta]
MPTDLLAALKGNGNNNGYNDYDNDNDNFMDSNYLTGFFNQVEQLRSEVDKIKSLVEEIKTKHNELLSAPNPDERTKARVNDIMADIKQRGGRVRTALKQMEVNISQEERAGGDVADIRIMRGQLHYISKFLADVLQDSNAWQTTYLSRSKDFLRRQIAVGKVLDNA